MPRYNTPSGSPYAPGGTPWPPEAYNPYGVPPPGVPTYTGPVGGPDVAQPPFFPGPNYGPSQLSPIGQLPPPDIPPAGGDYGLGPGAYNPATPPGGVDIYPSDPNAPVMGGGGSSTPTWPSGTPPMPQPYGSAPGGGYNTYDAGNGTTYVYDDNWNYLYTQTGNGISVNPIAPDATVPRGYHPGASPSPGNVTIGAGFHGYDPQDPRVGQVGMTRYQPITRGNIGAWGGATPGLNWRGYLATHPSTQPLWRGLPPVQDASAPVVTHAARTSVK